MAYRLKVSFDGDGHIIRNLTIDTVGPYNSYLGLFGYISGSSAEIKNLGLENVNITGGDYSCYLGGLCGGNGDWDNPGGTITNCYATGSVTNGLGSRHLDGLCGSNHGTITNCYATGSVTGVDYSDSLGGLCGYSDHGTITNCYATSSVTGGDYSDNLGGLCGRSDYGTITNCYATGLATGGYDSSSLGGLCGFNNDGTITNCYFYLFSGPDNSFGTALDDLQMRDAASFAGFDFAGNSNDGQDDYWTIVNGYCPKLTWQTDDGPLVPAPPVTTLSGSGYSYDPFQINNYADFTEFRTNSSLRCGYYILTTDIDLSGETFTTAVINRYFGGHFDGNGHIISNITINTAGAGNDYLGLFSSISASVGDLGIKNINITGGDNSSSLGGLCGNNYKGTITNCYATGSVTGGDYSEYLGGLCGHNYDGTITNCYAVGSVTGNDYLGGLCGDNYKGTITNCYATGSVTGDDYIGGLCGWNRNGTISNCYATGQVTGTSNVGGLVGYDYSDGIYTKSFWDTTVNAMLTGIGNTSDPNVIGESTINLQKIVTFTNAGWDFLGEDANGTNDFWRMCVDGIEYPKLSRQFLAGDFVCPDGVNLIDFAILSNAWLSDDTPTANWNEDCDLDDNGIIDPDDLKIFAEHWLCK